MAYKQKGCTPITAKIQKGTKGGVTNPLLKAMGVPMKTPSPAKFTNPFGPDGFFKKNSTSLAAAALGPNAGAQVASKIASYFTTPSDNANKTNSEETKPTKETKPVEETKPVKENSTRGGKITGKIGSDLRKAQYDKKGWKYDDTIKGYDKSGNKTKTSTSKAKTADIRVPKVSMDSKLTKAPSYDTSKITGKPKASATAKPSKAADRKQKAIDVKLTKAKAARAAGNTKKADRKERAAKRKTDRLNDIKKRNASPAKQTMQQQNRKEKREARLEVRRVAPKKGNAKMAKKAKVYGK